MQVHFARENTITYNGHTFTIRKRRDVVRRLLASVERGENLTRVARRIGLSYSTALCYARQAGLR